MLVFDKEKASHCIWWQTQLQARGLPRGLPLRAWQVLTVCPQLVVEEADSGRFRFVGRVTRRQNWEELSFSDMVSEAAPSNLIREEARYPNDEANRIAYRNEPKNLCHLLIA